MNRDSVRDSTVEFVWKCLSIENPQHCVPVWVPWTEMRERFLFLKNNNGTKNYDNNDNDKDNDNDNEDDYDDDNNDDNDNSK